MIKILALDKSLNTSVEDLQVIDCVTTCLISGEKKCRRLQKDIYCIYPVFFKNIFSSLKYFFLCNNNHSMQYNALSYYSVVCFFWFRIIYDFVFVRDFFLVRLQTGSLTIII